MQVIHSAGQGQGGRDRVAYCRHGQRHNRFFRGPTIRAHVRRYFCLLYLLYLFSHGSAVALHPSMYQVCQFDVTHMVGACQTIMHPSEEERPCNSPASRFYTVLARSSRYKGAATSSVETTQELDCMDVLEVSLTLTPTLTVLG